MDGSTLQLEVFDKDMLSKESMGSCSVIIDSAAIAWRAQGEDGTRFREALSMQAQCNRHITAT